MILTSGYLSATSRMKSSVLGTQGFLMSSYEQCADGTAPGRERKVQREISSTARAHLPTSLPLRLRTHHSP